MKRRRFSFKMRFSAVGAVLLTVAFAGTAAAAPVPAATDGTLLLSEDFTNAYVADSRSTGLGSACLTGAVIGSTPPLGTSNLSHCAGRTSQGPTPGTIPGWLQLTDASTNQRGAMIFDRALPARAGISVDFDQAQYGGTGNADGMSFFLTDGSRALTRKGADGGSLGYAQRSQGSVDTPGVPGGYLGLGIDSWGNFINDDESRGRGCATPSPFPGNTRIPNTVTLRGPGEGMLGYCFLAASAVSPSGPSTLPGDITVQTPATPEDAIRNVRIIVSPGLYPTVTVSMDFSGTRTNFQEVFSYTMKEQAPPTYKFGFSAATGASTNVHLFRSVVIQSIENLGGISLVKQVDRADPQPSAYREGDTVPYKFLVTNPGEELLSAVTVTDPLVPSISCPATTLGAGGGPDASMVCTGSLVVTRDQARRSELTNTATATGVGETGAVFTDTSEATVPLIVSQFAELALTKSASLRDTNSTGKAELGEAIDYRFVVTNTGTVPLSAVTVEDPMLPSVSCEQDALDPGETTGCSGDEPHLTTSEDVQRGYVTNTATAFGVPPEGVPDPVPPTSSATINTASSPPVPPTPTPTDTADGERVLAATGVNPKEWFLPAVMFALSGVSLLTIQLYRRRSCSSGPLVAKYRTLRARP